MSKETQLQAARRALGIVNRLKPGAYKARQVRRVFASLNRLRAEQKESPEPEYRFLRVRVGGF